MHHPAFTCTPIVYSTSKISYTKLITGRIRGYQNGTLDGFLGPQESLNINGNYVDGNSITSNNEHVWTFAAGCNCISMKPKTTPVMNLHHHVALENFVPLISGNHRNVEFLHLHGF